MRFNNAFLELKGIGDLARQMVHRDKEGCHISISLFPCEVSFELLTLPVVTTTVKRIFLVMKYVKNQLRNRMGDQWMILLLGHVH